MENRNCEMLFEFLRSILYDMRPEPLDLDQLDEPYRKLGKGLQLLQKMVRELMEYSGDIAQGNLSGRYPSRENFLCNNLKSIQANLNHLTWQARQVAAGDYSQKVSYLGEFSEAFNLMTSQLKERELSLRERSEDEQKRIELIEGYNDLLMTLTRRREEWILVIDEETREIVYCNKKADRRGSDARACDDCPHSLPFRERLLNWQDHLNERMWEVKGENDQIYRITTFPIEWRGKNAWAHIIIDITADKEAEEDLTKKAYHDAGTGIYNRFYFTEKMKEILEQKENFTLCYMDLDGLKHVNDYYGHSEGDEYIRSFVSTIRHRFRGTDVFARIGGDEFCLILIECNLEFAKKKMEYARENFRSRGNKTYPRGFSYGLVEVIGEENVLTQEEIIRIADSAMYEDKKKNKELYF